MTGPAGGTPSLAVVGMACRFPDADDPAELLDVVLTGRRAFRRLPSARLNLADYYRPDLATSDATYSTRAALIEGWRFDHAGFNIDSATYLATDPAHWLALETATRALDAAGLACGGGLDRDRTGVIMGNTLAGDVSRANALRLRWPFVRQVLTEALATGKISASQAGAVLARAESRYVAPFPATNAATLAGSLPGTIATGICAYFGFRGGGHTVDSAYSSSLQAVASACTALAAGDLDVALAGGVDISLDPLELIGLAKAGVLATADVRIYDDNPTGYLPGEGCGVVVLMRTADARAAGLPVHAEIVGWGVSGGGVQGDADSLAASHLLAMRRAYERAGIDPADVQYVEGNGSGTRSDDDAELAALASLRAGSPRSAALGSVKANIGHTKAAAGAAALIKTVLALDTGVVPPATGSGSPHGLISAGHARLELPGTARAWPDGPRHAAVSTMGFGSNAHLVLRREPGERPHHDGRPRAAFAAMRRSAGSAVPLGSVPGGALPTGADYRPAATQQAMPFLLHAHDRFALAAVLSRLAGTAGWLSDGQLQDLACQLGRDPDQQGRARVALVAARQEQLAVLAREAVTLLPHLEKGKLTVRPGIFASDLADGRLTLLLSGGDLTARIPAGPCDPGQLTALVAGCLRTLRWLESLDVRAVTAVGHGAGLLAGLAWAGVLGEADIAEVAGLVEGRQQDAAALRATLAERFRFGPPRRRLLSAATGAQVGSVADAIDSICNWHASGRLTEALSAGVAGSTLLVETGPGKSLVAAASAVSSVPAVSFHDGSADPAGQARVAGALFAAGALGEPGALFDGVPGRPIDIWRRQVFISSPCETWTEPARQAPVAARPADADHGLSGLRHDFERRVPRASDSDHAGNASPPGDSGPQPAAVPAHARRPAAPDGPDGPAARPAQWTRLFTEQLRPSAMPSVPDSGLGWRLHSAPRGPLPQHAAAVFPASTEADRTLAVLDSPADPGSRAVAVRAARDAMTTGRLVVLTTSSNFTGFFACVHAEHPSMGITVLRLQAADGATAAAEPPADGELPVAVRAAARFAGTGQGEFRELVVSPDGTAREPVHGATAPAGGGAFPLDPDDVVLISRGARGAALVLAQVFACCGNPVVVVGRPQGNDDSDLVAGLEELRSAGARVGYEVIDVTDPPSLAAAVERIADRFGPVRAIVHAASPGRHVPLQELTDIQVSDYLAAETAVLDQLVGSVRAGQLKLVMTVGSVGGRYGLAGRSLYALGSGALASRAAELAAPFGGCRALHADIPPLLAGPSGASARLGDHPDLPAELADSGTEAIDVATASRLLLKALASPDLPARFAIHGPAAGPALRPDRLTDAELAAAGLKDGAPFLREVVAHYPGAELVCEATVSTRTDPYLADYRIDGMPVLPEVMAIEALAEAASVLAGRPVRTARGVRMAAPVLTPPSGELRLRICARRDGNVVTAALRSAETSFSIDHVRAEFAVTRAEPEATHGARAAGPEMAAEPSALHVRQLTASTPGLVDGTELYGPICFQSGRFRRIALLPEVTALSCRALARGTDDQPWFARIGGGLLLGSPGLNDATLQVLQACVPHRRLRPAGCESVTFSGHAADGVAEIRAVAVRPEPSQARPESGPAAADAAAVAAAATVSAAVAAGSDESAAGDPRKQRRGRSRSAGPRSRGAAVPAAGHVPQPTRPAVNAQVFVPQPARPLSGQPAAGDLAHQLWDVEAVDAAGRTLVSWHKVALADVGPLPRNAAWPPQLLSVFLERGAADLGLDDAVKVTVTCGQPDGQLPQLIGTAVPRQSADHGARRARPRGSQPAPGRPARQVSNAATAPGQGPLAGFGLTISAAIPVACAWTTVESQRWLAQPVPWLATAYALLRSQLAEQPAALAARLQAVAACLTRAGLRGDDLALARTTANGWALLQVQRASIACVVVEMSGVSVPVAIALLAARRVPSPPGRTDDMPAGQPAATRAQAVLRA